MFVYNYEYKYVYNVRMHIRVGKIKTNIEFLG